MLWRTHLAVGINALWLLAPFPSVLNPDTLGVLAVAAGVGALLPDLDAARSKIRSTELWGVRPLEPLASAAFRLLGHRGLLHAPLGWAGFGLLCLAVTPWSGWEGPLGLFLGYGSHLLADSATRSGIPATGLCPWLIKAQRLYLMPRKFRLVTGSQAEDALLPVLAATALSLLLRFLM